MRKISFMFMLVMLITILTGCSDFDIPEDYTNEQREELVGELMNQKNMGYDIAFRWKSGRYNGIYGYTIYLFDFDRAVVTVKTYHTNKNSKVIEDSIETCQLFKDTDNIWHENTKYSSYYFYFEVDDKTTMASTFPGEFSYDDDLDWCTDTLKEKLLEMSTYSQYEALFPNTNEYNRSTKEEYHEFSRSDDVEYTIGNYVFSVPSYYTEKESDDNHAIFNPSNTDVNCALVIRSSADEEPVTYEWLENEENVELLVDSFEEIFDKTELLYETWIDDNGKRLKLIGFNFSDIEGKDGVGKICMFPSFDDNNWVMIAQFEYSDSEYAYGRDFYEMLLNIEMK